MQSFCLHKYAYYILEMECLKCAFHPLPALGGLCWYWWCWRLHCMTVNIFTHSLAWGSRWVIFCWFLSSPCCVNKGMIWCPILASANKQFLSCFDLLKFLFLHLICSCHTDKDMAPIHESCHQQFMWACSFQSLHFSRGLFWALGPMLRLQVYISHSLLFLLFNSCTVTDKCKNSLHTNIKQIISNPSETFSSFPISLPACFCMENVKAKTLQLCASLNNKAALTFSKMFCY